MRELRFQRAGRLAWRECPEPTLTSPADAIVRPFLASRCDGDTFPVHRPVSRALQLGIALGAIDPTVARIWGRVPFQGPFAIGHECVAEVVSLGSDVARVAVGDRVIIPWTVSCGRCATCRRGLTGTCETTREAALAAYGFGPATGPWGGMIAEQIRVPHADHMLVRVPDDVPSERVAAASDNLSHAWQSVVPGLAQRPEGTVLIIGGDAKSIGLYAAGLAVAHAAAVVDYCDDDPDRRQIAETLGACAHPRRSLPVRRRGYDIVVEASSRAGDLRRAVRALAPGGICAAVGYYLARGTPLPLMRMYATDATLHLGVCHARAVLPQLLAFLQRTQLPTERVTTLTAEWDDAPTVYHAKTTKLVLRREPLSQR